MPCLTWSQLLNEVTRGSHGGLGRALRPACLCHPGCHRAGLCCEMVGGRAWLGGLVCDAPLGTAVASAPQTFNSQKTKNALGARSLRRTAAPVRPEPGSRSWGVMGLSRHCVVSALAGMDGQPGPHLPNKMILQGRATGLKKWSGPCPSAPCFSFSKAVFKAPSRSPRRLFCPLPTPTLDEAGAHVCACVGLSLPGLVWLGATSGNSELSLDPLCCSPPPPRQWAGRECDGTQTAPRPTGGRL